jgi:microsomal dipeptidase-like Zn-dependent dipeptidase
MNKNKPLLIDCLQVPRPTRERFEEWQKGGVDCVHITLSIWENARETMSQIGTWDRAFVDNADLVALAESAADIEAIAASGRTAVVFGCQNSSLFEDDIDLVRIFHKLGVRIVQLTYNIQNNVGSGCWEEDDRGISGFYGRNLIKEMNQCGMLVDISHCGLKTSFDAAELSARPIAITHGNPSEFVGFDIELNKRNKPTDLIKLVVEKGGVLGLSLYPKIMRGGSNASLEDFCDMIEWSIEKFGIDAVAFGTDFYTDYSEDAILWWRAGRWARKSPLKAPNKFSPWPDWFKSPEDFPNIMEALEKRSLDSEDIAKIAGGNWLRLFRESFVSLQE